MQSPLAIGWKLATLSIHVASIRYRALLPCIALEARGIRSIVFSGNGPGNLVAIDVLIIVKSLTIDDLLLAQEAADRRIPVIFDLCDNIFIEGYGAKSKYRPADVFRLISKHLTAVTTTTEPLAQIILDQTAGTLPVYVIPDGIETEQLLHQGQEKILQAKEKRGKFNLRKCIDLKDKLAHRISLLKSISLGQMLKKRAGAWHERSASNAHKKLDSLRSMVFLKRKKRLAALSRKSLNSFNPRNLLKKACKFYQGVLTGRQPVSKTAYLRSDFASPEILGTIATEPTARTFRILWFGHHGASYASFGMLDILLVKDALERIAQEFSVELIVVSNSKEKYRQHIQPLAIPSRYIEWSTTAMEAHIRAADVVIIPNSGDAFSICKSANRAVLALSHGVPVVATHTPALEPLKECLSLDDFAEGLRKLLSQQAFKDAQISRGRQLIEALYGQQVIGQAWFDILLACTSQRPFPRAHTNGLIIALNQAQDIDLALLLLHAARQKGLEAEVWFSAAMLTKSARTQLLFGSLDERWRVLPERPDAGKIRSFLSHARYLISVSETNLAPHRFTHCIAKLANECGVVSATLQHGLENVGLTYSDEIHAIEKVRFASGRIYIWGPTQTLHPGIRRDTRAKCIPVGRPWQAVREGLGLPSVLQGRKNIIAIFENLHWHRYSDAFRDFFLEGVSLAAKTYPDCTFLVKPHPAGLWLISNLSSHGLDQPNIVIADPATAAWENLSVGDILSGSVIAAVTTPSTVALDAVSIGVQVAVVEHALDCSYYAPLPRLRTLRDWIGFIESAATQQGKKHHLELNDMFLGRVSVSGNAAELIIDDMVNSALALDR